MRKYPASIDKLTKIITSGVIIIMAVVIGFSTISVVKSHLSDSEKMVAAGVSMLVGLILFISYLYAPKYYIIDNGEIIVVRSISARRIPLQSVSEVKLLNKDEMKGSLRTFGSGGFFGFFGKFYNSRLGSFTMYGTQNRNHILIQTNKGKNIVLTPDDVSMAEDIKSMITVV